MRSESSLIFLVVIGVWAAYFVQYWIRRRDHLATARSVEQLSAAMRVLERRTPIPSTDLSDPAPRSWSVHPRRPARPQVAMERSVPATAPPTPTVTEPLAPRSAPRPSGPRPGRRVRAVVLVAKLLTTILVAALTVLGALVWWAPLVSFAGLVLVFTWVRSAVRAEQALRAARRRRMVRRTRHRQEAAPARSARRTAAMRPASATTVGDPAGSEEVVAMAAATEAATPVERTSEQVEAASEPAEQPAAEQVAVEPEPEPVVVEYVHLVDEDDIPLTWDPVPVPRPTYTMKAKAERPTVPPAEVTPTPAPAQAPAAVHEHDLAERRVAGA
ncbi:hypothetical protein JQN72_00075 [Phycicoccus sp. CSK15P-2]|uniref:hypothetical protein n=1 Tax=Phycicoccus sp. CSK15P-2 TaxID=2807627 RepID=UPI001951A97C|nr:hypothetical protein [Phycicoccus sp. CSK15P-2]MBM6402643.1 hypothetical protein [Phycicoccus sp. CSK15P-2]